jgi:hypothetical protein
VSLSSSGPTLLPGQNTTTENASRSQNAWGLVKFVPEQDSVSVRAPDGSQSLLIKSGASNEQLRPGQIIASLPHGGARANSAALPHCRMRSRFPCVHTRTSPDDTPAGTLHVGAALAARVELDAAVTAQRRQCHASLPSSLQPVVLTYLACECALTYSAQVTLRLEHFTPARRLLRFLPTRLHGKSGAADYSPAGLKPSQMLLVSCASPHSSTRHASCAQTNVAVAQGKRDTCDERSAGRSQAITRAREGHPCLVFTSRRACLT